jgi:hypothetical protein
MSPQGASESAPPVSHFEERDLSRFPKIEHPAGRHAGVSGNGRYPLQQVFAKIPNHCEPIQIKGTFYLLVTFLTRGEGTFILKSYPEV